MTTSDKSPIDEARLEAFVSQVVLDMGAAISGLLLHAGDRLGLYKAMAGAGPVTSSALAVVDAGPASSGLLGSAGLATGRPAARHAVSRQSRRSLRPPHS